MDMIDLKKYNVDPDEGMFERIERRLRRRRWMRVGGVAAGVLLVVAGVAAAMELGTQRPASGPQVSAVSSQPSYHQQVTTSGPTTPAVEPATVSPEPDTRTPIGREHVTDQSSATSIQLPPAAESQMAENNTASGEPNAVSVAVPPTANRQLPAVNNQSSTPEPDSEVSKTEENPPATDSPQPLQSTGYKLSNQTVATQQSNTLWAPNVIMPSSDDEQNRIFRLSAASPVSDLHLYIFNRGGRQVFSSTDINRGWDATYDGQHLPQGTYVWVARFRDSEGVLREEKGTVTIIR